ncbi:hypothetical protein HDU97_005349 [Phlyctochytrium planicorne]|nr:hypothetical protein HDU97_005349 [Phlyctochytrium planicorne]
MKFIAVILATLFASASALPQAGSKLGSCSADNAKLVIGLGVDSEGERAQEVRAVPGGFKKDAVFGGQSSALAFGIVANFICDRLATECKAPADVVSSCRTAQKKLVADGARGGKNLSDTQLATARAAVDTFNSAIGIGTDLGGARFTLAERLNRRGGKCDCTNACVAVASSLIRREQGTCAPGQTQCGRDCINNADGNYHCVYTPKGPVLMQGPQWDDTAPLAPILPASTKTIGSGQRTFEVVNKCSFPVWPGVMGKKGDPVPSDGGFGLASGQSVNLMIPDAWESGRIWPRTDCRVIGGKVVCLSGDCGTPENKYGVGCQGLGNKIPATLAEFTLKGWEGSDFYDISNVDGYSIGISIEVTKGTYTNDPGLPKGFDCGSPSCDMKDLASVCPKELQLMSGSEKSGKLAACYAIHSAVSSDEQRAIHPELQPYKDNKTMYNLISCACDCPPGLGCGHPCSYGKDQFCCSGPDLRQGNKCFAKDWPAPLDSNFKAESYDKIFKNACPDAYSWQFDDEKSTFKCKDANYKITFCPGHSSSKEDVRTGAQVYLKSMSDSKSLDVFGCVSRNSTSGADAYIGECINVEGKVWSAKTLIGETRGKKYPIFNLELAIVDAAPTATPDCLTAKPKDQYGTFMAPCDPKNSYQQWSLDDVKMTKGYLFNMGTGLYTCATEYGGSIAANFDENAIADAHCVNTFALDPTTVMSFDELAHEMDDELSDDESDLWQTIEGIPPEYLQLDQDGHIPEDFLKNILDYVLDSQSHDTCLFASCAHRVIMYAAGVMLEKFTNAVYHYWDAQDESGKDEIDAQLYKFQYANSDLFSCKCAKGMDAPHGPIDHGRPMERRRRRSDLDHFLRRRKMDFDQDCKCPSEKPDDSHYPLWYTKFDISDSNRAKLFEKMKADGSFSKINLDTIRFTGEDGDRDWSMHFGMMQIVETARNYYTKKVIKTFTDYTDEQWSQKLLDKASRDWFDCEDDIDYDSCALKDSSKGDWMALVKTIADVPDSQITKDEHIPKNTWKAVLTYVAAPYPHSSNPKPNMEKGLKNYQQHSYVLRNLAFEMGLNNDIVAVFSGLAIEFVTKSNDLLDGILAYEATAEVAVKEEEKRKNFAIMLIELGLASILMAVAPLVGEVIAAVLSVSLTFVNAYAFGDGLSVLDIIGSVFDLGVIAKGLGQEVKLLKNAGKVEQQVIDGLKVVKNSERSEKAARTIAKLEEGGSKLMKFGRCAFDAYSAIDMAKGIGQTAIDKLEEVFSKSSNVARRSIPATEPPLISESNKTSIHLEKRAQDSKHLLERSVTTQFLRGNDYLDKFKKLIDDGNLDVKCFWLPGKSDAVSARQIVEDYNSHLVDGVGKKEVSAASAVELSQGAVEHTVELNAFNDHAIIPIKEKFGLDKMSKNGVTRSLRQVYRELALNCFDYGCTIENGAVKYGEGTKMTDKFQALMNGEDLNGKLRYPEGNLGGIISKGPNTYKSNLWRGNSVRTTVADRECAYAYMEKQKANIANVQKDTIELLSELDTRWKSFQEALRVTVVDGQSALTPQLQQYFEEVGRKTPSLSDNWRSNVGNILHDIEMRGIETKMVILDLNKHDSDWAGKTDDQKYVQDNFKPENGHGDKVPKAEKGVKRQKREFKQGDRQSKRIKGCQG